VGDGSAYDHASIVRAGFYDYFGQTEVVELPVGSPLPGRTSREPPMVEVTRGVPAERDVATVSVSGFVSDDAGLSHVMIFHGDDKVFYEGGAGTRGLTQVPFTVDVPLTPGSNIITILARDEDGLTATHSEVAFYEPPEQAATAPSPTED
jgi:hypothetical protein